MATIINLISGQSVRTTDNSAADIAGLINANAVAANDGNPATSPQAIYQCTDIDAQAQHHIVVDSIVSVYEH